MTDPLVFRAGVAFPMRVDQRGGIGLAQADDHIDQSIALILATAPGERAMRPDFGCELHSFTFEAIDVIAVERIEGHVRRALDRWEPRIEVLSIDLDLSRLERQLLMLSIGYRLRATGRLRRTAPQYFEVSIVDTMGQETR